MFLKLSVSIVVDNQDVLSDGINSENTYQQFSFNMVSLILPATCKAKTRGRHYQGSASLRFGDKDSS